MSSSVGISVTGVQKLAVEAVSAAIQLILETPAVENKTKIAALETLLSDLKSGGNASLLHQGPHR